MTSIVNGNRKTNGKVTNTERTDLKLFVTVPIQEQKPRMA